MAKVSGQVDKIVQKTTKLGKTFYTVLTNGQLYSLWQAPNFSVGDQIEFDEIIKGDFKNMANPSVSEGKPEGQVAPVRPSFVSSRPNGSFDPDRESRIVRQNATSSAVALVAASKLAGKSDVESLLATVKETAKKLYEMNFYGYDFDLGAVVHSPTSITIAPILPSKGQDVDALLKQF